MADGGVFGFGEKLKEGVWCLLVPLHSSLSQIEMEGEGKKEVGRKPSSFLVLDNPHTSGAHCYFTCDDGEVFVHDTSRNGTFVNTILIGKGKKKALKTGDEVTFVEKEKDYGFSVQLPEPEDEATQGLPSGAPSAPPPELFEVFYKLGERLAGGTTGEVYKATSKETGEEVAVKLIPLDSKTITAKSMEREVEVLKSIKHKSIVSVLDVFQTEEYLYIVLELATGGELFDKIVNEEFCESDANVVFSQILDAVEYMHSQGVAHRDIKPENVLLVSPDSLDIKLTDFGTARFAKKNELMMTCVGTIDYLAPEIFMQKEQREQGYEGDGYSMKVDMWSAGVLLYVLLCGCHPFGDDPSKYFAKSKRGRVTFPKYQGWAEVSNDAKDLIKKLMVFNPKKRLSATQAKKHAWFKNAKVLRKKLSTAQNYSLSLSTGPAEMHKLLRELKGNQEEDEDEEEEEEEEEESEEEAPPSPPTRKRRRGRETPERRVKKKR